MIAKIITTVIRGYQKFISPLFGAHCRFYPSCSEYGVQAVTKHGSGRGLIMTLRRLLKCGPWHPGGIDPVP